ncbi:MAG: hypothetical protein OEV44_02900 [Spirochaetota bacterium]|nr:hypothetical protein [Spirochaetota bacterium]
MNIFESRKTATHTSYTAIAKEIGLSRSAVCRIIRTPWRTTKENCIRVSEILGIPYSIAVESWESARAEKRSVKNEQS